MDFTFRGNKVTSVHCELLTKHLHLVATWNAQFNLVSRRNTLDDLSQLSQRSLNFLELLPAASPATILDIGSGAGFPAVPAAILLPHTRVTLLESRLHKTRFLEHVKRQLALTNLEVVRARFPAGELTDRRFNAVISQAVGDQVSRAAEIAELLAPGGIAVMTVGKEVTREQLQLILPAPWQASLLSHPGLTAAQAAIITAR